MQGPSIWTMTYGKLWNRQISFSSRYLSRCLVIRRCVVLGCCCACFVYCTACTVWRIVFSADAGNNCFTNFYATNLTCNRKWDKSVLDPKQQRFSIWFGTGKERKKAHYEFDYSIIVSIIVLLRCPDTSAALPMCLTDSSAVQPKCLLVFVCVMC